MKASFLLPLILTLSLAPSAHAQDSAIDPQGIGDPPTYPPCNVDVRAWSGYLSLTPDSTGKVKVYNSHEPTLAQRFTGCPDNEYNGKLVRQYSDWNIIAQKPTVAPEFISPGATRLGARINPNHKVLVLKRFDKGPGPDYALLVDYTLYNRDLNPVMPTCPPPPQGLASYQNWLSLDNAQFDVLDTVTVEMPDPTYYACIPPLP